ncbi:hypothetical protein BH23CHL2_BH23CHL2_17330 [soil metagenome]
MEHDEFELEYTEEPSGAALALLLGVVLVLMIIAFVWFVVRLDPLTHDFVGNDDPPVTVTAGPAGS